MKDLHNSRAWDLPADQFLSLLVLNQIISLLTKGVNFDHSPMSLSIGFDILSSYFS